MKPYFAFGTWWDLDHVLTISEPEFSDYSPTNYVTFEVQLTFVNDAKVVAVNPSEGYEYEFAQRMKVETRDLTETRWAKEQEIKAAAVARVRNGEWTRFVEAWRRK